MNDNDSLWKQIDTDWTLCLWGEERVNEKLRDELRNLAAQDPTEAAPHYGIQVRSLVMGRWLNGSIWQASPALRLQRKSDIAPVGWFADSERRTAPVLPGWIEDYSANTLTDAVSEMCEFSDFYCWQFGQSKKDLTLRAKYLAPAAELFRLLLLRGFLFHGIGGVAFAILAAYSMLLNSAKVWETSLQECKSKLLRA